MSAYSTQKKKSEGQGVFLFFRLKLLLIMCLVVDDYRIVKQAVSWNNDLSGFCF